jgi:hypothetical protein
MVTVSERAKERLLDGQAVGLVLLALDGGDDESDLDADEESEL